MKVLFIGGIKSGKSLHAEQYCLDICPEQRPIYLATCEFFDQEMAERISAHQQQRGDRFNCIEEPLQLVKKIASFASDQVVLIDCLSMWLNNMLYHKKTELEIFEQLHTLSKLPQSIIMVINEVGCSVVADNPETRRFVDLSGKISQYLARQCDQVYLITAGIHQQLK